MSLWSSADAIAATGGTCAAPWEADGVSIDTRSLQAGDLFVALEAARDGHDFVQAALDSGAAAALVSRIPEGVASDAPLLIVPDVLRGLEDLGRAARARTKARVLGVTGSVGKTSTKEMLRDILIKQGRTHASVASYNNHWGVPLTLARMPQATDFAVIEIGMNHPGEIAPLARMANPDVVLITTVAAAHLEAFNSLEGIAAEKASIIEGLKSNGTAVLNADIETAAVLQNRAAKAGVKQVLFGQMARDFELKQIQIIRDSTVIQAQINGAPVLFKLGVAGRHFAMNALGALAAAEALGADLTHAALDIAAWLPVTGRGQRDVISLDPARENLTFELIDDAYNANPASLAAALEVLSLSEPHNDVGRVGKGRRIAYLGDMKELGPDEVAIHAGFAQNIHLQHLDVVHCVGPLMQNLWHALPEHQRGRWVETAPEMLKGLGHDVDAGDVVLVKASLSTGLGQVVDAIRKLGHPSAHNKIEDE
ncbi:UDP-N-acetylmuramoyl-tripeptide--D-alanyl-D-alanine ligase [Algirhabdus cladophorae]|uniref:UDP-N-acetylmuramoyl-tripeptide--D-alanyl-D- alanine ligase n=1 Tax=Algirhabdus cladophorae TaxID=3377108 RepID=UPI003B845EFD